MNLNSITVLLTTYNSERYLYAAIKSILKQTYKNFELLIIDDGSTDNTENLVATFNDPRINYNKVKHCGRSAVLNFGLNLSKNDWIAIMDADDIAHPSRLEKQINCISGENNEVCFTNCAFFRNDKLKFVIENDFNYSKWIKLFLLHGHFTNSTFVFNKTHILNLGGYDENLRLHEDYDLWLRLIGHTNFKFVNEILQFARISGNSLTATNYSSSKEKFYEIQNKYIEKDIMPEVLNKYINNNYLGWREFFYGNPKLVKQYWLKVKFQNWDYRMILAFILSLFPIQLVNVIKKQRLRLRLQYLFSRFAKYKYLKKEFNHLMKIIDRND